MNDKKDYTYMFLQIKKLLKKIAVYRAAWDRWDPVSWEKRKEKNIKAENVNKSSTKLEGSAEEVRWNEWLPYVNGAVTV